MELDDELCLCFHVTKRKVLNWIRIERPQKTAQLSECYGAGTGCGWCRPFLQELFEQQQREAKVQTGLNLEISAADYAAQRARYVLDGKGQPPAGAEPSENDCSDDRF